MLKYCDQKHKYNIEKPIHFVNKYMPICNPEVAGVTYRKRCRIIMLSQLFLPYKFAGVYIFVIYD